MGNLSNDTSRPELPAEDTKSSASHKMMLITMALLVASLTLTGTMMLHYAKTHNRALTEAATSDTEGGGALTRQTASLFMTKLASAEKKDAQPSTVPDIKPEDKSSMLEQLFHNRDSTTKWPKLKLSGFGSASDGSGGFAIINNHQYHVGQTVNGKVKLIDVRKHEVLVEFNGESKILTVNVRD